MTEVLYLKEEQLARLVMEYHQFARVEFDFDEEFLPDEPEGVLVLCQSSDEGESELRYFDLLQVILEYCVQLNLKFCGWRLFTPTEGVAAALLVKKK